MNGVADEVISGGAVPRLVELLQRIDNHTLQVLFSCNIFCFYYSSLIFLKIKYDMLSFILDGKRKNNFMLKFKWFIYLL